MLPDQLRKYRNMVTLKDGTYVLLRPMEQGDLKHLVDMFSVISEEDLHFFRHDVRNTDLLQSWCDDLNYENVLPVLALVKDKAVGIITLHFFKGSRRHIGEIRLFLSKDYRKRGLGTKMTRVIIELAKKQGLRSLFGEVIRDQTKVIKAFEEMGFISCCILEDHFMFPDGETTDVVLLTLSLIEHVDEF